MAIRFRCPRCGKAFEVPDQYAGRRAQCKGCSAAIQIPSVSEPLTGQDGGQGFATVGSTAAPAPQASPPAPAGPPAGVSSSGSPGGSAPPAAGMGAAPPEARAPAPALRPQSRSPQPPKTPPQPPEPETPAGSALDNGSIIGGCILLLLTIGVPWTFLADEPVWSWHVLDALPAGVATFVIGEWIIAGVLLLLGLILRGSAFSITLTGLSALGLCLMLGLIGKAPPWPAAAGAFAHVSDTAVSVEVMAALSVLAFYVVGNVRLRLGKSIPVNVLLGVSAGLCIILMLMVFLPSGSAFLDLVNRVGLKEVVSSPAAILGGALIAQAFVILAGLLALIHAWGAGGEAQGYTQAAVTLIRVAVGLLLAEIIVFSGIAAGSGLASLAVAIGLVLVLTMPALFLAGAIRTLGDLLLAGRRALS